MALLQNKDGTWQSLNSPGVLGNGVQKGYRLQRDERGLESLDATAEQMLGYIVA